MLIAKVLNSDATLNHFHEVGSLEFISGEQLDLVVRLWDTQADQRYIPPVTNITTFTLNNSDTSQTNITGAALSDDRSIITVVLSEIQTSTLLGGNVNFSLDILGDGTEIRKGIIQNGLARILDGSEC